MVDSRSEELILDYLDRLDAQLAWMPYRERDEIHQEIRQHLYGLTAAHRQPGSVPEEDVAAALRSFGNPVQIGRKLFREWRQATEQGYGRVNISVARLVVVLTCSTMGLALGRYALFPICAPLLSHLDLPDPFSIIGYVGMLIGVCLTLGTTGGLWLGLLCARRLGRPRGPYRRSGVA